MLQGKKILIGITGSIAAYKIPVLVRQLIKKGAEVKVVMTPASEDFVSKLTLSTLTHHPVLSDLFNEHSWSNHVMLGRWADIMLVAPLSCNSLSKMAHGACDNLLLAIYLSATCPVMIAPAMDEDMWLHPSTQKNLQVLRTYGCQVLPVGFGELASGLTGQGRMAEIDEIEQYLEDFFQESQDLKDKKVLVTAGPTYEAIDPVRFIGNHSSGKMGYAVAEECKKRGAEVTLVSGPVHQAKIDGVTLVQVVTAEQMFNACMQRLDYDIAVMAAAVADYTPVMPAKEKIKKGSDEITVQLGKTKDILATLGKEKTDRQILVGFALETNDEEINALMKLQKKNADLVVLNSLKEEGAGFGHDTNKVQLFFRNGTQKALPLQAKKMVAKEIVDSIISILP
jgi:phosphopantothenoylcysteine decarboxylase/phosphopantothenate--cysteine ligase